MRGIFVFAIMFAIACNQSNASKLDEKPRNIARENAKLSFPDAKCDEDGFVTSELHSVRCTLKNGLQLYCSAGIGGSNCQTIFVPEEVQKAAEAEAQARASQQPGAPVVQPAPPPTPGKPPGPKPTSSMMPPKGK